MTTLAELAASFEAALAAVDMAFTADARVGVPADDATLAKERMARQLVDAWRREMDDFLNGAQGAGVPPQPAPAAPGGQAALPLPTTAAQTAYVAPTSAPAAAQGPLADTLAKIAAGIQRAPEAPAPPPAAPATAGQGSFDEWVALADALGRNVQDVIRRWHGPRDGIEGGWDKATDAQRAEQYGKALAYYQNKMAEPGEIDFTRCFKCGSQGRELKTRNGELFYACSNDRCGFNGREGNWISTTWDPTTWSEKRAKWEQTKKSGQTRGRSYAGRR